MILFINTTDNEKTSLSLKGKRLFHLAWASRQNQEETILPQLGRLLKKAKAEFKDITKIVVVKGPGFFSRVRLGVVTANALAFALGIPIVGVEGSGEPHNLSHYEGMKGQSMVIPYYDRQPNITKPKRKK